MKPYEIINHIVDDLLCSHFKDDYCLLHFPDHIRYNPNQQDPMFLFDKHFIAVPKQSQSIFDYFFHNNKWIIEKSVTYRLRHSVGNIFVNHSWEPIYTELDKDFWNYLNKEVEKSKNLKKCTYVLHSEVSSKEINILKNQNIKHVYWFAHAYLCSEFYFKHYKKFNMVCNYKVRPIVYKWLSANRLLRSHRTDLLEQLDLSQGCYSLLNPDPNGLKYTGPIPAHSFDSHENHSAEICIDKLTPWNTSFLHVVNETVWQDKIHFTEKIFKPIVMHQPFVVVQAPGSLKYLQSYGFKTFGDWWDESYDDIQDPAERLQAIAKIIKDIGSKDIIELEKLRMEMAGVLEHNFHHFYENIPAIVLGELENNIRLLS